MIKSQFQVVLFCFILLTTMSSIAQKKPDIKGNRTVAVVDKALGNFHSVVVEEDLELSFKKAEVASVHFVADDNLPPVFNFEVKDSVLHISSYYRIKSKKELKIEVSYIDLQSISVMGGRVQLDINSNSSALQISGTNKSVIEVYGIADQLSADLSDSSYLKLTSSLQQLAITTKGKSSVDLSGVYTKASFDLSERSSITALGSTSRVELKQSGTSKYLGKGLKVTTAQLSLNGDAIADLYAIEKVELSLDQQSILHFYGTAQLEVKAFLGTSQILKKAFDTTQE